MSYEIIFHQSIKGFILFFTTIYNRKNLKLRFFMIEALLICVFSNVSSNCLLERKQNHTGCICLFFLHYVFLNGFLSCLPEEMQNHTGCICLAFLHCVFSNVFSNGLHMRMHSHTCCICLAFLHCVF